MIKKNGFTLIEMMVGVGILSVVSLGFMYASRVQVESTQTAKKAKQQLELLSDLNETLKDQNVCETSLKNLAENASVTEIKGTINHFQVGTPITQYPGVSIKSMTVKNFGTMSDRDLVQLEVILIKKANSSKASDIESVHLISLGAVVKSAKIETCSAGFLEEKNREVTCESIGGTFGNRNCNNTFVQDNCEKTGGVYNTSTKKCLRTKQSDCVALGGQWVAGNCTKL
ncbi:MAG: type II secretion system protein [Bacteriovoracaceae bacterium]|nr:type II secretion system protein [Bacteriovoracaceae bacterium]